MNGHCDEESMPTGTGIGFGLVTDHRLFNANLYHPSPKFMILSSAVLVSIEMQSKSSESLRKKEI